MSRVILFSVALLSVPFFFLDASRVFQSPAELTALLKLGGGSGQRTADAPSVSIPARANSAATVYGSLSRVLLGVPLFGRGGEEPRTRPAFVPFVPLSPPAPSVPSVGEKTCSCSNWICSTCLKKMLL